MSGETNLETLLRSLSAKLDPELYVFVTIPDAQVPDGLSPRMLFREDKGTTLILTKAQAVAHHLPHEFPCRMITLTVHSSLEAVGFIARIASELAKHAMGVNPVSGFYHDHLFIPDGREGEAFAILDKISKGEF